MTPFDEGNGLGGLPIGSAQYGGEFAFDPFDAYERGLITNPNMIVAGAIGAGKSTLVKMLADRALQRGRRVVVVDPKGEYGALAQRYGIRTVALGRGGWCNPFCGSKSENKEFLRALLASAQGSDLTSEQHFVLDAAWTQLPAVTPKRVLRALLEVLSPTDTFANATEKSIGHTLHRFVNGDLQGLFDGEGSPLSFEGDLVVIDLSSQWMNSSMSMALLSVIASAQQIVASNEKLGYLVLDESWALLEDEHALRWLQGSWKLARSRGLSHTLVLHRWSDVGSAGNSGSAQRGRAHGLLKECETMWLFRQPPDEASAMSEVVNLSSLEERYLLDIPKGVALVRYGRHRSIVRINPFDSDRAFIDTDAAMRR